MNTNGLNFLSTTYPRKVIDFEANQYIHTTSLFSIVFVTNDNGVRKSTTFPTIVDPVQLNYYLHQQLVETVSEIFKKYSFGGSLQTPPVPKELMSNNVVVNSPERTVSLGYTGVFQCLDYWGALASNQMHCFLVFKTTTGGDQMDMVYDLGIRGTYVVDNTKVGPRQQIYAYASYKRDPPLDDDGNILPFIYIGVCTSKQGKSKRTEPKYKFERLRSLDTIMSRPLIQFLIP